MNMISQYQTYVAHTQRKIQRELFPIPAGAKKKSEKKIFLAYEYQGRRNMDGI